MIKKYRLINSDIEALQYTGDNLKDLMDFAKAPLEGLEDQYPQVYDSLIMLNKDVYIRSHCGWHLIHESDYIIKIGEHYSSVISQNIFKEIYEEIT